MSVVRVRVLGAHRQTIDHGTGWVASKDTIVTARHVVFDARGVRKGERIVVDVFSCTDGVWALGAHPARWIVVDWDGELPFSEGNDRARLAMDRGGGVTAGLPPPLPLGEASLGADAAVFGFALADAVGGASTFGGISVRHHLDQRGRALIQLSLRSASAIVTAGFSGAPLVVEGEIVGMIVLDPAVMPGADGGPAISVSGLLNAVPIESVLRAWPDLDPFMAQAPGQMLPVRPYRYLHPYGPQDAPLFFGRGAEIAQILNWLDDPGAPAILLVYGSAGTGKSSLLHAGLRPRLGGRAVRYQRWEVAEAGSGSGVAYTGLPILDQAEGAFDPVDLDGMARLGRWLDAARGAKAVLAFRKEWLAEVTQLLETRGSAVQRLLVAPLSRRGIIEVARGPARRASTRRYYALPHDYLSLQLAERIADDLGSDPGSPVAAVLQVLLSRLWDRLPEDRRITAALYEEERHSREALGDFLTRQRQLVATRFRNACALGLELDILEGHVGMHGQASSCSAKDRCLRWGNDADALVRALVDHWLLVVDGENTRLAHDTLGPEVLRAWHGSTAPGQRARRLIEARVAAEIGLLSAEDLGFVEQGMGGMRALTPDESKLLSASRRAQVRAKRRTRALAAASVVLVMGMCLSAYFVWDNRKRAEASAEAASESARHEDVARAAEAWQHSIAAYQAGDDLAAAIWASEAVADDSVDDPKRAIYIARAYQLAMGGPARVLRLRGDPLALTVGSLGPGLLVRDEESLSAFNGILGRPALAWTRTAELLATSRDGQSVLLKENGQPHLRSVASGLDTAPPEQLLKLVSDPPPTHADSWPGNGWIVSADGRSVGRTWKREILGDVVMGRRVVDSGGWHGAPPPENLVPCVGDNDAVLPLAYLLRAGKSGVDILDLAERVQATGVPAGLFAWQAAPHGHGGTRPNRALVAQLCRIADVSAGRVVLRSADEWASAIEIVTGGQRIRIDGTTFPAGLGNIWQTVFDTIGERIAVPFLGHRLGEQAVLDLATGRVLARPLAAPEGAAARILATHDLEWQLVRDNNGNVLVYRTSPDLLPLVEAPPDLAVLRSGSVRVAATSSLARTSDEARALGLLVRCGAVTLAHIRGGYVPAGTDWAPISEADGWFVPLFCPQVQDSRLFESPDRKLELTLGGGASISIHGFQSGVGLSPLGPPVVVTGDDGVTRPLVAPAVAMEDIGAAALSSDGRWLALTGRRSGPHRSDVDGDYGLAQIWAANTGDPVSEPLWHPQEVRALGFNRAGDSLLTMDASGVVRRWPVGWDAEPSWIEGIGSGLAGGHLGPSADAPISDKAISWDATAVNDLLAWPDPITMEMLKKAAKGDPRAAEVVSHLSPRP